jgi:hypothetical protein
MSRLRRPFQSILVVTLLMLGLTSGVASAATARTYGDIQIAQSYEIPITNPADDLTYQSVVLVSGAHLDTRSPITAASRHRRVRSTSR